jgi:site-specific recombinase XerD
VGLGALVRTRNARLAAIHSLFSFAALRHPEHAEDINRILAIPAKRTDHTIITFLTDAEVEAILASPDLGTRTGRRDHTMILLAVQTGLRASELVGLTCRDVHLGAGPYVACHGKGRKDRITPLTTSTAAAVQDWLAEHHGTAESPLFPSNRGQPMSRDALERRLARHTDAARQRCPSLTGKKITPHVLRHYVDGWVMWPVRVFPLAGVPRGPVPAT